jgi:hypothetical protein
MTHPLAHVPCRWRVPRCGGCSSNGSYLLAPGGRCYGIEFADKINGGYGSRRSVVVGGLDLRTRPESARLETEFCHLGASERASGLARDGLPVAMRAASSLHTTEKCIPWRWCWWSGPSWLQRRRSPCSCPFSACSMSNGTSAALAGAYKVPKRIPVRVNRLTSISFSAPVRGCTMRLAADVCSGFEEGV